MNPDSANPQSSNNSDARKAFHEEQLKNLLKQREEAESSLKRLEEELYNYEEQFLVDTAEYGNIVKGLNVNAIMNFDPPKPNAHLLPRFTVNDIRYKHRVFSNTSLKSPATRIHQRPKPSKSASSSAEPSPAELREMKSRKAWIKEILSRNAFDNVSKEHLVKKSSMHDVAQVLTKTKGKKGPEDDVVEVSEYFLEKVPNEEEVEKIPSETAGKKGPEDFVTVSDDLMEEVLSEDEVREAPSEIAGRKGPKEDFETVSDHMMKEVPKKKWAKKGWEEKTGRMLQGTSKHSLGKKVSKKEVAKKVSKMEVAGKVPNRYGLRNVHKNIDACRVNKRDVHEKDQKKMLLGTVSKKDVRKEASQRVVKKRTNKDK